MTNFKNFILPSLQELYSASPSERFVEWRRLGARDKVGNIRDILGKDVDRVADILEVGCGTGAVLAGLVDAQIGRQRIGVEVGRIAPIDGQGGYEIITYDGKSIPFPPGSFDFVYATHVLEHVLDERAFLGELARVSRRFIYVEVPCEVHLRTTLRSLQKTLKIGHINAYTPETFGLTLETSGLRVLRLALFDHSLAVHQFGTNAMAGAAKSAIRKLVLKCSSTLASRLFTYHCGALCESAATLSLS